MLRDGIIIIALVEAIQLLIVSWRGLLIILEMGISNKAF